MLTGLLIGTMLSVVTQSGHFQPDASPFLTLPIYPALSARAGIEGDFTVTVEIEGGQAKKVNITKGVTRNSRDGKDDGCAEFCGEMKQAVMSAPARWQFRSIQNGSFSLTIAFRHKSLTEEKETEPYTIYKVRRAADLPPSEILIELHCRFPRAR